MADDPYKILGVAKSASADEIRKAYRALAKKSHPDLHPGDKGAEVRFKALNAANDILSDPEKRGKFDRGEIDAEGQQTAPEREYYRDYAQAGAGARYQDGGMGGAGMGGFGADDAEGLFGAFFRQQANRPRDGRDRTYKLDVPFLDAVNGALQTLTLPDGQTLNVRIPPGIKDGGVLRLRGKGEPGQRGGADGDALIEVSVFPHPLYQREGADLVLDLPVTFAEAVLGAKVEAPTPRGRVMVNVPPKSETGTRLRLRGRGVAAHGTVPAGDLHVQLRLVAGPVDEALETFLKTWTGQAGFDPRATMEET
jgi:DnaJ-class molecular chaperone